VKITDVTVKRYSASRDPRADVAGIMADNPLLEFQSRLFRGPILREEATEDEIFLIPPDTPGLGLALDEAVAAAALVPE
jgi:L-alanine-DL-glutamate epimerase-like enolase superfamily enzyme